MKEVCKKSEVAKQGESSINGDATLSKHRPPPPPLKTGELDFLLKLWGGASFSLFLSDINDRYREHVQRVYGVLLDTSRVLSRREKLTKDDRFFVLLLRVEVYVSLRHYDEDFAGKRLWASRAAYHFEKLIADYVPDMYMFRFMHCVAEMAKVCDSLNLDEHKEACLDYLDNPHDISQLEIFIPILDEEDGAVS